LEKNNINDRIRLLVKVMGMNNNSFANLIGTSQSVIFNISDKKGRKSKPSYDVIMKILNATEVDLHWLMKGEGEPFKPDQMNYIKSDNLTVRDLEDLGKYSTEPLSTEITEDVAASYGGESSAEAIIRLKAQVEMLRELIQAKDQHLEDIRDMMRLYEHMLSEAKGATRVEEPATGATGANEEFDF